MNKELVKGIVCAVGCVGLFSGGLGLGFVVGRYNQSTVVSTESVEDMTIQEIMSARYRDDPNEAIDYAHSADGQPGIINSDYEAYLNTIVRMEQMRAALNMGASFKEIGIEWE